MTKGLKEKKRKPDVVMQTYVLSDRVICYRILSRHLSRKRSQTLVMSGIHKTNQKKWMEKNNASNRKYNTGKRAIPGGARGTIPKGKE